ncbi:hypothetical protein IWW48_004027 [Coemansia sp. RSA 1200]|nr:hypothetical protein IWW48_004027 [Coemansia sp. RSA 1200]
MRLSATLLSTLVLCLLGSSVVLGMPADANKDAGKDSNKDADKDTSKNPADSTCKGHTSKDKIGQPFAHPTQCTQYITCSEDGKPYVSNCPGGTYYDTKLSTCTIDAKASCGDRKV